jgi:hypothetical protein
LLTALVAHAAAAGLFSAVLPAERHSFSRLGFGVASFHLFLLGAGHCGGGDREGKQRSGNESDISIHLRTSCAEKLVNQWKDRLIGGRPWFSRQLRRLAERRGLRPGT